MRGALPLIIPRIPTFGANCDPSRGDRRRSKVVSEFAQLGHEAKSEVEWVSGWGRRVEWRHCFPFTTFVSLNFLPAAKRRGRPMAISLLRRVHKFIITTSRNVLNSLTHSPNHFKWFCLKINYTLQVPEGPLPSSHIWSTEKPRQERVISGEGI